MFSMWCVHHDLTLGSTPIGYMVTGALVAIAVVDLVLISVMMYVKDML